MTSEVPVLLVVIEGRPAGILERDRDRRLRFTYDDGYRFDDTSTPMSLSMPFTRSVHDHDVVSAFCENLLPDSTDVRSRWARMFQTRDNAFDLLTHVGEDCAGAVQFVRDDRIDELGGGGVDPMTEAAIGQRIRDLRTDPSSWMPELEHGQFSLAGAQAKFALHFDGTSWGLPYGSVPTTHIIKPTAPWFTDHEINEHLTLALANACGLAAARSQVCTFDGERALVVERYDRHVTAAGVTRIHQEDCCQALGLLPAYKYEHDGGPSAADIVDVAHRSDAAVIDVLRISDALIFNWTVANTDAHAKNFSVLLAGPSVRVAPLYDMASWLVYIADDPFANGPGVVDGTKLKSAMRIGEHYLLRDIDRAAWVQCGNDIAVDGVVERADQLCGLVIDHVAAVCDTSGIAGAMVERYAQRIERNARRLRHVLAGTSSRRPRVRRITR